MQFCMLVVSKFAWVQNVKLPIKYPWHSGKFRCTCRQFACILREVLAASTQLNLLVFLGKLHVMKVNCVWGLFTSKLQVKLPAFAGNFARASFAVHVTKENHSLSMLTFFTVNLITQTTICEIFKTFGSIKFFFRIRTMQFNNTSWNIFGHFLCSFVNSVLLLLLKKPLASV